MPKYIDFFLIDNDISTLSLIDTDLCRFALINADVDWCRLVLIDIQIRFNQGWSDHPEFLRSFLLLKFQGSIGFWNVCPPMMDFVNYEYFTLLVRCKYRLLVIIDWILQLWTLQKSWWLVLLLHFFVNMYFELSNDNS